MKKLVSILLVIAMLATLFVACSDDKKEKETEAKGSDVATTEQKTTVAGTEEATVEPVPATVPATTEKEEPTTIAETEPVTEAPTEATTEESTEEATVSQPEPFDGNLDVSEDDVATAGDYTDIKNPAKLGQWVKAYYVNGDTEHGTYYWRIVDVTNDCEKDIEEWNAAGHIRQFTKIEQDAFEYKKVTVQYYFPKDYKCGEYGISTSTKVQPSAKNPDGGGFTLDGVTYIGLGQGYSIHDTSVRYNPGESCLGVYIYAMLKDFDGYVFDMSFSNADGEYVHCYSDCK